MQHTTLDGMEYTALLTAASDRHIIVSWSIEVKNTVVHEKASYVSGIKIVKVPVQVPIAIVRQLATV